MGKFLDALRDELILYVRHSAWLNTAPEHPDDKPGVKRKTRRAELEKKYGAPLVMPECDAQYLLSYLFEVGPSLAGGMGEAPLTHVEILAWEENTGVELNAWEARMLKRLSVEWVAEKQHATSPSAPLPWADAPYCRVDPAEQAARLQRHLEGLAK